MKNKPILITQRLERADVHHPLILGLTAEERTKLRGKRQTNCGVEIVMQLPREGPLIPGEILSGSDGTPQIVVEASIENLLQIRGNSTVELIKAGYHLGNRHVELEVYENEMYISDDPVLQKMLIERGLTVRKLQKTFHPEPGAYIHTH